MKDPYKHLASQDPKLGAVISRVGELDLERKPVDFHSFLRSIVFQQLSGKAATTIFNRLLTGIGAEVEGRCDPSRFDGHSIETLREYGLSRQKSTYILDLAQKSLDGQIHFGKFEHMEDDAIIAELTQVKGIGEWTVQMVLMFSLARPDVMATNDLGLQHGMRILDGLSEKPKPKELLARAEIWKPYRSYASMYLWQLKDE